MGQKLNWTIEDNVVALYLAMYGDENLKYEINKLERIISRTLFPKEGFKQRIDNYRYIITGKGLDAGYKEGFPLYKDLYRIFSSMDKGIFKDYVNLILDKRKQFFDLPESAHW
jgi:hypothetical protein